MAKRKKSMFGIEWHCDKCKKSKLVPTTNAIVVFAQHAKTKCKSEFLRLFVVELED